MDKKKRPILEISKEELALGTANIAKKVPPAVSKMYASVNKKLTKVS